MKKTLNKKSKFATFIIIVLIFALILLIAIFARMFYIKSSQNNLSGSIISISYIENPESEEDIADYLGKSAEDYIDSFSDVEGLTDDDLSVTYDLESYNVYKIEAEFYNESDMSASITMNSFCKNDEYIIVPSYFPYEIVSAQGSETWTYYCFVSKNYTQDDIENYLTDNGATFNSVFQKRISGGSFKITAELSAKEEVNFYTAEDESDTEEQNEYPFELYQSFLVNSSEKVVENLNSNPIDEKYYKEYSNTKSLEEEQSILSEWADAYKKEFENAQIVFNNSVNEKLSGSDSTAEDVLKSYQDYIDICSEYADSVSQFAYDFEEFNLGNGTNHIYDLLCNELELNRTNTLRLVECICMLDGNYDWSSV